MENSTYIWVPQNSSNRTAFLSKLVERTENNFLDKNCYGVYPVAPFEFWENDGRYYSENPNCMTAYKLIEAPEWFGQNDLETVSRVVAKLTDRNYDEAIRSIKFGREVEIKVAIDLIDKIKKAIDNNLEIDLKPKYLIELDLTHIILYNKIYVYQVFSNKYVRL